jgi:uncharacterized repeat protein (TIGR02543 family)
MGKIQPRLSNLACLILAFCLGGTAVVFAQNQQELVVLKSEGHAFGPPLSQLKPIPPTSQIGLDDDDDDMVPLHVPRIVKPMTDSVLQPPADEALAAVSDLAAISNAKQLSTTAGVNFLGLGQGFPGFTVAANIPDTNGAAGPTQFVQFVNDSFAVFNKSNGSLAYGPAKGNTLWQSLGGPCAANVNLDEVAQYDKLANVWVMMMPQFTSPTYICIAVSTTSNAVNGGWNLYAFRTPVNTQICDCRPTTDYPKLAVWTDGYYLSWNQIWNGNYIGAEACVVQRSAMIAGQAATMQCFSETSAAVGSFLPADLDGTTPPPSGSPEYYLSFDGNDQSLDLYQFQVNWTTPASSTFTGPTNIPVAAFIEACGETMVEYNYTTGDCIPQSGSTTQLDSYGDRLMYRLAYRNLGSSQALVANQTVQLNSASNQTGLRWYELQNTGSGFSLNQEGTYAPDSNYRWMGSIAMDHVGDIAMGYSVSGSAMNPSIRYTGRVPGDTPGTMEGEVDVLSAAGINPGARNNYRWADYSSISIDPTDDCTFWYTTEYIPTTGNNWSTRIASFNFPTCSESTGSFTLTASSSGQGTIASTDGNIDCVNGSGTCSAVYASGSSVTLNATASAGFTFTGWSGTCIGTGSCNVVMNSNVTVTAKFVATPAWSVVHKTTRGGSSGTITVPATGSGHLIAVALIFNGTTSVSGVSDNAGNTYVSAGARCADTTTSVEIWYAENSTAGATAITAAFVGAPTGIQIGVWEVSGVLSMPLDATGTATGKITQTNTPGPPVTTTMTGDFVVSVMVALNSSFTSISAGNEFTNDFNTYNNGWAHITSNSVAPGTQQASWVTSALTGQYCGSTVAFAP